MLSRFASAALVAALACTMSGAPALANTPSKADKSGPSATRPDATAEVGKKTDPVGKLKADMLELVADAKAGKTGTAAPHWGQQPAMSNGLSKGQKIAIGVGIAVAVVVTIIVFKASCDGLCE